MPLYIVNTLKQIKLIKMFAINAGKKTMRSGRLMEKWKISKKEKNNDAVIKVISKQKMIQRGAKFFNKLLGITINFFGVQDIRIYLKNTIL